MIESGNISWRYFSQISSQLVLIGPSMFFERSKMCFVKGGWCPSREKDLQSVYDPHRERRSRKRITLHRGLCCVDPVRSGSFARLRWGDAHVFYGKIELGDSVGISVETGSMIVTCWTKSLKGWVKCDFAELFALKCRQSDDQLLLNLSNECPLRHEVSMPHVSSDASFSETSYIVCHAQTRRGAFSPSSSWSFSGRLKSWSDILQFMYFSISSSPFSVQDPGWRDAKNSILRGAEDATILGKEPKLPQFETFTNFRPIEGDSQCSQNSCPDLRALASFMV
jgi:hypothetical protein